LFGRSPPATTALPFRLLFGQAAVFDAKAWVSYRRIFVNRI